MDQVRVGVVGAGRMGQRHVRVFSNMRKVQLAGICDVDPVAGRKLAQQFDAPFYATLDELLKHVDAVILATPTPMHYEQALQCINQRIHVLIEKPVTQTLEQSEALTQAAEKSGLVVQVGHIERFNPAYIELKTILNEIPPLAINLYRLSPFQGSNVDVDVVLDLMIHDTNLVLDLLGSYPTMWNAYGISVFSNTIDHAVAQLCFEHGPILTLTASRITENKVRKMEVTGHEAYVECDLLSKTISVHRRTMGEYLNSFRKGIKYRQESIVEQINIPTFEPLFLELQHFSECILENKAPSVSASDGYRALKLVYQIRDCIMERLINMDRRKESRAPVIVDVAQPAPAGTV